MERQRKITDWTNNFKYSQTNNYDKNNVDLDLLTDKGVYPYDYMNSWDKFEETELPSKEDFYSQLSQENISDEEYTRAKLIWKNLILKISVNIMIYI